MEELKTVTFHFDGYNDDNAPDDMTHLVVDDSVTEIPDFGFAGFVSLRSVKLPHGLLLIGEEAFARCRLLNNVDIPSTVIELERGVFFGCHGLDVLNLPDSIETIGEEAFVCCEFTNFRMPSKVTQIEDFTFEGCVNLTSIELPEGIERIGVGAFKDCTFLSCIYFTDNCTDFGDRAFEGCTKLQDIMPEDEDEFIEELRARFDDRPFHRLCYHQSYHEKNWIWEELLDLIAEKDENEELYDDEDNYEGSLPDVLDTFYFTPFHILAASIRPNWYLWEAMHSVFPSTKDQRGRECVGWWQPISFLSLNISPGAGGMLRHTVECFYKESIDNFGLESWKTCAMKEVNKLGNDQLSRNEKYQIMTSVDKKVSKLVRKELSSMIELAAWKYKMEEVAESQKKSKKKWSLLTRRPNRSRRAKVDKEKCRVLCGSDIIIENVLPFLAEGIFPWSRIV
jgi:hypothetical protein